MRSIDFGQESKAVRKQKRFIFAEETNTNIVFLREKKKRKTMSSSSRIKTAILLLLIVFGNCWAQNVQTDIQENMDTLITMLDSVGKYEIEETEEKKPTEYYTDFIYKPEVSKITIPIEIEVSQLEKEVNENLKGTIYEDNNIEDDSLKLKISKCGTIAIKYVDNKLSVEVPMKILATYRIGLAIPGLHTDREFSAAIKVNLSSTLNLSKNWSIISKTTIDRYEWIEKPSMKIAGFNVPIKTIVEMAINREKPNIVRMIDQSIAEKLPIREYAENLWNEVQKPINIETEDYNGWVTYDPEGISTTPIIGKNGKITTSIEADCRLEVSLNLEPIGKEKKELPECKIKKMQNEGYKLEVMTNLPYSMLSKIATETVKDENFGNEKHKIKVKRVNLYGTEDELGIEVEMKGFVNGKVYMTGKPQFTPTKDSICIKDVQYKLDTKNIMMKTVNMLIKPRLKRMIEEDFKVGLTAQFESVKESCDKSILNTKWGDSVYSTGDIKEMRGKELFITPSGIQASIIVIGSMKMTYGKR